MYSEATLSASAYHAFLHCPYRFISLHVNGDERNQMNFKLCVCVCLYLYAIYLSIYIYISNQIKPLYCLITTAQVPWWVKFLRACSRQCKTVRIYRLYRRQCAKYTYIYSVHTVYYKDIVINTHYTPYVHNYMMIYIYIYKAIECDMYDQPYAFVPYKI